MPGFTGERRAGASGAARDGVLRMRKPLEGYGAVTGKPWQEPLASLSAGHVARANACGTHGELGCCSAAEEQTGSGPAINGTSCGRSQQRMQDQGARALMVAACRNVCDSAFIQRIYSHKHHAERLKAWMCC